MRRFGMMVFWFGVLGAAVTACGDDESSGGGGQAGEGGAAGSGGAGGTGATGGSAATGGSGGSAATGGSGGSGGSGGTSGEAGEAGTPVAGAAGAPVGGAAGTPVGGAAGTPAAGAAGTPAAGAAGTPVAGAAGTPVAGAAGAGISGSAGGGAAGAAGAAGMAGQGGAGAAGPSAPQGVFWYAHPGTFSSLYPGLFTEDFEEAIVSSGTRVTFASPLDSSTDNAAFDPGDIVANVVFATRDSSENPGSNLAVSLNYGFGTSTVLTNTSDCDSIDILFSGGDVHAVGLRAYAEGGAQLRMEIYGAGDVLLDMLDDAAPAGNGNFIGVYSTEAITRVNIESPPGGCGAFEAIDDLQFGTGTPTLLFFSDRTAFETTYPGLPVEDFEAGTVSGDSVDFAPPLDATTNNGVFATGDIIAGVTFNSRASGGGQGSDLTLFAPTSGWGASQTLAVQVAGTDGLDVLLSDPDVHVVGLDLFTTSTARGRVSVYGSADVLLGHQGVDAQQAVPTFLGIFATEPITRVRYNVPAGGSGDPEAVDNVSFGN